MIVDDGMDRGGKRGTGREGRVCLRLGNRGGTRVWTTLNDPAVAAFESSGDEGM